MSGSANANFFRKVLAQVASIQGEPGYCTEAAGDSIRLSMFSSLSGVLGEYPFDFPEPLQSELRLEVLQAFLSDPLNARLSNLVNKETKCKPHTL